MHTVDVITCTTATLSKTGFDFLPSVYLWLCASVCPLRNWNWSQTDVNAVWIPATVITLVTLNLDLWPCELMTTAARTTWIAQRWW